jgi:hypothetical protein
MVMVMTNPGPTLDLFVPRSFEHNGPIDDQKTLVEFFEALMNMDAISGVVAAKRERHAVWPD